MPEQEPVEADSSFDRWSQPPVIGTRGLVLAVLVPVLLAAGAFGIVSWKSEGTETQATVIRVPTGDWIPGQAVGTETIRGALSVDSRQCVYLETEDAKELWPVWPAGFIARLGSDGKVSLYDGKDHLVARDGETIQASGTFTSASAYVGEPCLPSDDKVAAVQSEVTAVG
ncbi:hypothetical protein ABLE68_02770 [Nocardioides sp. CN2-186]|uniref:hypothetical protein n=1 Tax=Nocardioides tweenelious TaxID=3156607 RepID=UPI0032B44B39